MKRFNEYHKRLLPHIQEYGGVYSIVFRLAWSIPVAKLKEISIEKRPNNDTCYFTKFDNYLDTCSTPNWLLNPKIAKLVENTIHFHDNGKYLAIAFCIMPNHVHLILEPLFKNKETPFALTEVLHSIKTYTAKEGNRILGRKGQFWSHESYDHLIRNEKELYNQIEYLKNNPVKAKLVADQDDWEYTWVAEDIEL